MKCFGITQWLNPFVLFWLYHVVFLFGGIFYRHVYEDSVLIESSVIVLIWSGLLLTTLGALMARAIVPGGLKTMSIAGLDLEPDRRVKKFVATMFFVVGATIAVMYFLSVGTVPFLADDAEDFRVEARMGKGFMVLLAIAFLKYSVFTIAVLKARQSRGVVTLVPYLCAAFVLALGIGNRAPALEIVLFAVLIVYAARNVSPPVATLTLAAVIGLTAMAFLGILRRGLDLSSTMMLLQAAWRPFANIQNLQWIYDAFPDNIAYLYGFGYLIDVAVVLPGYSPNFGTWFKEQVGLDFSGGSVTVSYLGESYANFGWIGVVSIACICGFILAYLFYRFRICRNAEGIVLLACLATSLKSIVSSGFVSVLLYDTCLLIGIHLMYKQSISALRWLRGSQAKPL
ncbi:MAG TPA: O-antigen polymerase [Candidatus Deferrimicrobium sp.]|nr:O-antigen polymerase [Candidatus Deferrimicrobium sp.]